MTLHPIGESLDDLQREDIASLLSYLNSFWNEQVRCRDQGRVVPRDPMRPIKKIMNAHLPLEGQDLRLLLSEISQLIHDFSVKNSHPLFLGYVTPPSLDIGVIGDALAGLINQNVAFATLSPLGANLESKVVSWLGEIVGFPEGRGGVLTSGGSEANLYALAAARRNSFGPELEYYGNGISSRNLRIYCSDYTHLSIDKAAVMLGLGRSAVRRIPADGNHRIILKELRRAIREDLRGESFAPAVIVANAGTRLCCAFDDLLGLRELADEFGLWLHVDAAYGGFLRLARSYPQELDFLGSADSIIMDPHKLLFVPFECGALLVRDRNALAKCFQIEGSDYIELPPEEGVEDFSQISMQLGRSMKALKVWLTLKYIGLERFGREYSRLLSLAQYLKRRLLSETEFELLGPVKGTAVCFRWAVPMGEHDVDELNTIIRRQILSSGFAFIDEVVLSKKRGMRVCFTNYRTERHHVDKLVDEVRRQAYDQINREEGEKGRERMPERVLGDLRRPQSRSPT